VASFTLAQVPGWEVLAAASRLAGVPLLIAPPDGIGAPRPAAEFRWGDPEALRAAADEWTRAGREVVRLGGPSGELRTTTLALRSGWTGAAAASYFDRERRLEASFEELGGLPAAVAARLHDLADELDRTIEQQVARVLWTVAAIAAPLATWSTNGAAAPIVVNALVRLTERLGEAARSRHTAAIDQRRGFGALLVAASDGTARLRASSAAMVEAAGAWGEAAGRGGRGGGGGS
jgi:uncharacterized protein YukE